MDAYACSSRLPKYEAVERYLQYVSLAISAWNFAD
jgi:hypothetical protein